MPCWRQSAVVAAPASCSFRMPTTCSCVNRLPRMLSSLGFLPIEDSHYLWTSFRGAGHSPADDFVVADLRDPVACKEIVDRQFDEVYQLAADMGGAGFIFTGNNDAAVMHNSATINLNMVEACRQAGIRRVFYSSSACIYPEHNQLDPDAPVT